MKFGVHLVVDRRRAGWRARCCSMPAAVGIFTNSLHNESRWPAFPAEHYLTLSLKMAERRRGW